MAIASGFERIFETGPVFRAEKSHTNKHATEFSGLDLEFAHVYDVKDIMNFEAELLVHCLNNVKEKYGDEIKQKYGIDVIVPTLPFPTLKLEEVYKILKDEYNYEIPAEDYGDMPTEGEKLCLQIAKEKFNHEFLFITDFSKEKRAFYHKRINNIPQGFDLI
jgi:aspartyl-tRNA synthetase